MGAEHASVCRSPRLATIGDVVLQLSKCVVDSTVEDHLGGSGFQSLGRKLTQQSDRVVVQLSPANRVEVAKDVDDLGVPGPPDVARESHALTVKAINGEILVLCGEGLCWRVDLDHSNAFEDFDLS